MNQDKQQTLELFTINVFVIIEMMPRYVDYL